MARYTRITSDARFTLTDPAEITWLQEDATKISFQDQLDALTNIVGLTPYNAGTTYTGGVSYIVGYGGQAWMFISATDRSGITPGTDATVWRLLPGGVATSINALLTSGASGKILRANGVGFQPSWSTTTFPDLVGINKFLYASSGNAMSETGNMRYNGTTLYLGTGTAPQTIAGTMPVLQSEGSLSVRASTGYYIAFHNSTAYRAAWSIQSDNLIYYRVTGAAGAEVFTEAMKIANADGAATFTTNTAAHIFTNSNAASYAAYFNSANTSTAAGGECGMVITNTNNTPNNGAAFFFRDSGLAGASAAIATKFTNNTSHYGDIIFYTRSAGGYIAKQYILSTGQIAFGNNAATPTAWVHLMAGTATASTAPLKFTSGTNLGTPENGAIEYNGTNFFGTRTGAVRENIVTASAVNSVSPTAPNRTITININGTTYYIHAKTTND